MKYNKRLNDVIDNNNNTDGCEGCPGPDEADCKVGKICLKVAGAGCPDVSNCLACPAHDNLKATCSKAVDHSFTGLALCALPVLAIFPGQWKQIETVGPLALNEYICWDLCGVRAMHVVDTTTVIKSSTASLDESPYFTGTMDEFSDKLNVMRDYFDECSDLCAFWKKDGTCYHESGPVQCGFNRCPRIGN